MTRSDLQAAESSLNDSRDPLNVCSPFTARDASPILPENPDEWLDASLESVFSDSTNEAVSLELAMEALGSPGKCARRDEMPEA
eukprot:2557680-Rhodomonas_salina.1